MGSSAGDGEVAHPNVVVVSQAAVYFLLSQGSLARGPEEGLASPGARISYVPLATFWGPSPCLFFIKCCVWGYTDVSMCLWICLCMHLPVHMCVDECGCPRLTLELILHEPLWPPYSLQ